MPPKTQVQIKQQVSQPAPNTVSGVQWGLMIATALFFDVCKLLLQLIPVAGQILAIVVGWFAFATFWLWFTILGAKYSKGTMMIGFISDFIPFADVLSETTTIVALYIQSKGEKIASKVPGGKAALRMAGANQQPRTVSYAHQAAGSTNESGNRSAADRQPLPQNNKVVDIGAARERLNQYKDNQNSPVRQIKTTDTNGNETTVSTDKFGRLQHVEAFQQVKRDLDPNKERENEQRSQTLMQNNDALDQLNKKENLTREENIMLTHARYIMMNKNISDSEMNNPVYAAAWEKSQAGVEVYDPITHRDGYKFSNLHYL